MFIKRILSNNAVVADSDGHEVVAMGAGIGYKRAKGSELAPDVVERVFVPSRAQPIERLSAFLAEIPAEDLGTAVEVCEQAGARLGIAPSQALVIAVADHLSFAVRRQTEDIRIDYPLGWEIAQLYPEHLQAGRQALEITERRLGVRLPDDEAISFAMHFINAQAAGDPQSVPATRQLTLISQIFDVIDSSLGVRVDRESMSASRFVTHLRYVFARIDRRVQIDDTPHALVHSISETYPDEMATAQRIAYLVQVGLRASITGDETAFVALHVARLVKDVRGLERQPGHGGRAEGRT
ncbi:PRD domain-containing protein [Raineyella sp.]|nr:PRD domain-containing protein [Raineyella sp.]MEA5153488.1 PRD domain-containing protein [Raineyella sp.]